MISTSSSITPGVDTIELHVRSYRSALQSTLELTVNSLTNSQLKMAPILHPFGNDPDTLDTSALVYSLLRLPSQIDLTRKVIIGQTPEVFAQSGFSHIETWPGVTASARRRTVHFNPHSHLLAVFAASISDIDDLTNLLIAYQTEWNKFHVLLNRHYKTYAAFKKDISSPQFLKILNISLVDWGNISEALGPHWKIRLKRIYNRSVNIRLRLLAGSWIDYTKTTQKWWKNIAKTVDSQFHISHQDIYFVSSNNHSLVNIYTGFTHKYKKEILAFTQTNHPHLYQIWTQIQNHQNLLDPLDFYYFASRYFLAEPQNQQLFADFQKHCGVITIPNAHYLDITVQLIPVKNIVTSSYLDTRLKISRPQAIRNSSAIIFNINYPLGFAAYHIFNETLENAGKVKGLYILGKAAVLNSEIGDIQIPRVIFDEHTQNTYLINNCFNTFFPFNNNQGSILTNQKSVSVLGTFLENEALLDTYSKNNFTVIEMESGPYMSAVTECTYDQQTPRSTIVDLNNAPLDIGIINYTSDTPYSKAKNLGSKHLTLDGVEPVYLGSLAILQRIINLEENL